VVSGELGEQGVIKGGGLSRFLQNLSCAGMGK
jgi:hypothetical protein